MLLDEKIIFWIIEKFGFCYYELLIPQEGTKDASVFNFFEGKHTQEVIGDLKENLSILGTGTYSIHLKVSKRSRGKKSCKTLSFQLTEPIHKEMPDQSPTGKTGTKKGTNPEVLLADLQKQLSEVFSPFTSKSEHETRVRRMKEHIAKLERRNQHLRYQTAQLQKEIAESIAKEVANLVKAFIEMKLKRLYNSGK